MKALQADLTALSSNSVQRTITGELAVASGVLGFVAEASLDLRMAAHAQESQSG
jgi:hypothetical protein